ncbi:hypothetical protein [Neomegalonema sp.]|uniref:hypothetical protein n=1 Tax=Neomegalonema sp. TaxID=2039713 RepID=UPI00261B84B2|nr:hypothetical protein [Neomegalonema sp.]MDD2870345.1 hypothetical protein [Neomegalonema sp.]
MKPGRKAKFSEVTKVIRIPESREKEVLLYLNKVPKGKARAVMALIEKHLAELPDEDEPAPQLTLITSNSSPSAADESLNLPFLEIVKSPQEIALHAALESLQTKSEKIAHLEAVIRRYKDKIHPTSPRWANVRTLIEELEAEIKK